MLRGWLCDCACRLGVDLDTITDLRVMNDFSFIVKARSQPALQETLGSVSFAEADRCTNKTH